MGEGKGLDRTGYRTRKEKVPAMKFPPGYGYPSTDDWERIDAANARPRNWFSNLSECIGPPIVALILTPLILSVLLHLK